jgi:hypothetical protein
MGISGIVFVNAKGYAGETAKYCGLHKTLCDL